MTLHFLSPSTPNPWAHPSSGFDHSPRSCHLSPDFLICHLEVFTSTLQGPTCLHSCLYGPFPQSCTQCSRIQPLEPLCVTTRQTSPCSSALTVALGLFLKGAHAAHTLGPPLPLPGHCFASSRHLSPRETLAQPLALFSFLKLSTF